MPNKQNVEFRIMPNGDRRWYWEVVKDGREIIRRGLTDTKPAACREASDAARKAKLLDQEQTAGFRRLAQDAPALVRYLTISSIALSALRSEVGRL